MTDNKDILLRGAKELGLELSETQIQQFVTLASELENWNEKINLTRIPPEQTVTHHFLDSLTITSVVKFNAELEVLDVGTGAGYPGLPLAIVFPEVHFVLLDSTRKKLIAIEAMAETIGLKNVSVLHSRAEDLIGQKFFDVVTTRAVASFEKLLEWQVPLVKKGGVGLMMKSSEQRSEVADSPKFKSDRMKITEIQIPTTDIKRLLVAIR